MDGFFRDVDGNSVRAYDDVVLLDHIAIQDTEGEWYTIPAGTIATVLSFQEEPDGAADLECSWPESGFSFALALIKRLRFHMSTEEKYSGEKRGS